MKLTFITNACCIYEADGFRLLSDPWLTESCFMGQWLHDPPITTKPEDLAGVDALYISHIHEDHCDPETLRHFRRGIKIVCLDDRFTAPHLRRMGFSNAWALPDGMLHSIGPFALTIFGPFCKHPHVDCEVGNVIDSALLIKHEGVKVLNLNDNTPTVAVAEKLAADHGPFDVVQINYNNAGPYPACFDNLTWEQKRSEHFRLIERNLTHMVDVAKALKPRYVMPFAGAYKLANEALNPVLGTTTPEHAAARAQLAGFETIVLAEGESFELV